MARGPLLTDDERQRIRDLVPIHGIRATAAILHRAPNSVANHAHEIGVEIYGGAEKRGLAAAALLSRERRLGLIAGIADHVESQLAGEEAQIAPKDLRDLAVSLGIAVDKQRLEEGLSSANLSSHIVTFAARSLPDAGT